MLPKTQNPARFLARGRFKVSVFGLGHVGASVTAVWLRAGVHVIGVDKSSNVVESARLGKTHIGEPGVEEAFKKALREGRFEVTTDAVSASKSSEFKIMTVPVYLSNMTTDLSTVKNVAENISMGLKKGDIVSFNATVPPGTTEEFVLPILERGSGLKCEKDFGLVYTPERIYEGRAVKDIEENYPTIVGGAGPQSLKVGATLYSMIAKKGVIKMSTIKSAEFEKVCEGVYRDVNIALSNELVKISEQLGVDFWETRNAANSQPFCSLHKPGTGVGGACIPVYPHFLIETAEKMKIDSSIAKLARHVNSLMPKYCVMKALSMLNKAGKSIANSKVVVLGLAFRGGVSDTRLSPSYDVIHELLNAGCTVIVHDPYVSIDNKLPSNVALTKKLDEALYGSDLVIIATDHPQYKKLNLRKLGNVAVYDGRGILDRSKFASMLFSGIGRGK